MFVPKIGCFVPVSLFFSTSFLLDSREEVSISNGTNFFCTEYSPYQQYISNSFSVSSSFFQADGGTFNAVVHCAD